MAVETLKTSVEEEISALLREGRIWEAQQLFASAGDAVPPDSKIRKALAPPIIREAPATGRDRSAEFHWLKSSSAPYRGQWVALLGDALVARADALNDLLMAVERLQLSAQPLVVHLD